MKMHAAASDKGPLRAEYHLLWPSGGRIGALEQKLCERWRRERIRFRCPESRYGVAGALRPRHQACIKSSKQRRAIIGEPHIGAALVPPEPTLRDGPRDPGSDTVRP